MTRDPAPGRVRPRPVARTLLVVALLLTAALGAGVAWLAVGDDADEVALALALATHAVEVEDVDGVLTVAPSGASETGPGVVFVPGTRIERAAYVATWAPIVEATGVTVYVPAVPLNLPVLAADPIGAVIEAHPDRSTWIVGGHSMGGFEAAAYVATADVLPAGLLLWGSGPGRAELADAVVPTMLVAGGSDSVLPLDRALGEGSLPPDATIAVIDGMVHGQFGRYSDTEDPRDPDRRSDVDTLDDLVATTSGFIDQVGEPTPRSAPDTVGA